MSKSVTIRATFQQHEHWWCLFDDGTLLAQLVLQIQRADPERPMHLSYLDDEGDVCSLTSEAEMREALLTSAKGAPLHVRLTDCERQADIDMDTDSECEYVILREPIVVTATSRPRDDEPHTPARTDTIQDPCAPLARVSDSERVDVHLNGGSRSDEPASSDGPASSDQPASLECRAHSAMLPIPAFHEHPSIDHTDKPMPLPSSPLLLFERPSDATDMTTLGMCAGQCALLDSALAHDSKPKDEQPGVVALDTSLSPSGRLHHHANELHSPESLSVASSLLPLADEPDSMGSMSTRPPEHKTEPDQSSPLDLSLFGLAVGQEILVSSLLPELATPLRGVVLRATGDVLTVKLIGAGDEDAPPTSDDTRRPLQAFVSSMPSVASVPLVRAESKRSGSPAPRHQQHPQKPTQFRPDPLACSLRQVWREMVQQFREMWQDLKRALATPKKRVVRVSHPPDGVGIATLYDLPLAQLYEMGYTDTQTLMPLLARAKGDVRLIVAWLASGKAPTD